MKHILSNGMASLEQTKTYSRNAHHMIMSYNDKVYHVDSVKVNFSEGKELHDAVFHAKEVSAEKFFDLHFSIPHMLCDILIEYAKLNDSDAILVLDVKGNRFIWNLLIEAWLKQTSSAENVKQYVA